jgi:endonuclease/exonuclease/phosphatase family metal-dependent hydrolase
MWCVMCARISRTITRRPGNGAAVSNGARRMVVAAFLAATGCAVQPRMAVTPSGPSALGCRDVQLEDGSRASSAVIWLLPDDPSHQAKLDATCRGVGPVVVTGPAVPEGHRLREERDADRPAELIVVSWNTYLGRGDLSGFVSKLTRGAFTDGRPVDSFALLLQEVYRSQILAFARERDLHAVYAPSRRRAGEADDRGAAILSTLPVSDLLLVELPFEKQRRIALGATIVEGGGSEAPRQIRLVNVHFDTNVGLLRGGPSAARRRQARALIEALGQWPSPLVVGGDFNTWWGDDEPAIKELRRAFPDTEPLRTRETWHGPLGTRNKLDYVFAKGLSRPATVRRLVRRFGSDHWPLLAVVPYSPRSATAGSIRVARHAGAAVAAAAVTASTIGTTTNVTGSHACTPKRTVPSSRLAAAERIRPIAAPPATTLAAFPTTSRIRSPLDAPSARRTPKSRTRCWTE